MTNSPTSYWDVYDFFHRRSKMMLAAVADLILPKVQEGIQSGGLKNLAPVCTEQHIQYLRERRKDISVGFEKNGVFFK
jgi:hypothetical protein